MKVTWIIKGTSESFLKSIESKDPKEAFQAIRDHEDMIGRGLDRMEVGDGSTRDAVEFNTKVKGGPASFRLDSRKGYKLATFEFN